MKNRNKLSKGWWLLALVAMLAVPALADDGMAGIYKTKFNSVVTSSSLKWSNLKKENMDNYVVAAKSDEGPIYICRAKLDGDMLLGQLRPEYNKCTVSETKSYDSFEVLENIENASLIMWNTWNKFSPKPDGAIVVNPSATSVFIGRTDNIARISYENDLGRLITLNEQNKEEGEVLIEIEPVSYKLENVVLDEKSVRQKDPIIFRELVLSNEKGYPGTVSEAVEYEFNYTVSWGHGHGLAAGLNTIIDMPNGPLTIGWANPLKEERKELYKVEKFLEPGTSCNVTFRGNYTDRDAQYSALLITSYSEGQTRSRPMQGERIENTVDVEAIYGEVYFSSNYSLVPTTTSTTTTTTTTTTPAPPPTIAPPASEEEDNENTIASEMKKPDHSGEDMLGDSGENMAKAPQSKEDNIKAASVGGLGSKPNDASRSVFALSLLVLSPLFAMLL